MHEALSNLARRGSESTSARLEGARAALEARRARQEQEKQLAQLQEDVIGTFFENMETAGSADSDTAYTSSTKKRLVHKDKTEPLRVELRRSRLSPLGPIAPGGVIKRDAAGVPIETFTHGFIEYFVEEEMDHPNKGSLPHPNPQKYPRGSKEGGYTRTPPKYTPSTIGIRVFAGRNTGGSTEDMVEMGTYTLPITESGGRHRVNGEVDTHTERALRQIAGFEELNQLALNPVLADRSLYPEVAAYSTPGGNEFGKYGSTPKGPPAA